MRLLFGVLCIFDLAVLGCGSPSIATVETPTAAPEARPGDDWVVPRVRAHTGPALLDDQSVNAVFEDVSLEPEQVGRGLVDADGSDIVRRGPDGSERLRRSLSGRIETLVAHPRGLIVDVYGMGASRSRLKLLDPDTLRERWSVDRIHRYLAVTETHAYALQDRDRAFFFIEVDLRTGEVVREMATTGRLLSPVLQHGTDVAFFASDREHRVAQGESSVVFERIDVARWSRRSIEIDESSSSQILAERIVDAEGQTLSFLAVLRSGPRQVLSIDAQTGELRTRALPERTNVGRGALVPFGGALLFAAGGHVHVYDLSGELAAILHFPEQVRGLERRGDAVRLDIERRPLLMRVGQPHLRLERVRTEPWRFGEPELATDGDASTVWRYRGEQAVVQLVFDRLVVVPRLTLSAAPSAPGVGWPTRADITYHLTEFGARGHGQERVAIELVEAPPGPQPLVNDYRVARRVSISLRCACANGQRCQGCQLADIGFTP